MLKPDQSIESYREAAGKNYRDFTEFYSRFFLPSICNPLLTHGIRCMDEGSDPNSTIYNAGSGILFAEDLNDLRNNLEMIIPEGGLVTAHEGCGAAVLYANQHGSKYSETSHDLNAAGLLIRGTPYGRKFELVKAAQLYRPSHLHPAFGAIIYPPDHGPNPELPQTGSFFRITGEVPNIETKLITPETVATQVVVALGIACGDHGLGREFFDGNKFLITLDAGMNGIDQIFAAVQASTGESALKDYCEVRVLS